MKEYYLIMERPPGSNIWTFNYLTLDRERAEEKAIEITHERNTCTRIVTALLPMEKDTFRYAMMADNDSMLVMTPSHD
jgi:hypothetical protein